MYVRPPYAVNNKLIDLLLSVLQEPLVVLTVEMDTLVASSLRINLIILLVRSGKDSHDTFEQE